MSEFSELDLINGMYEEDINDDRHFDETLIEKKRYSMKLKKGDYVYYFNRAGDTYPTQIYAVGQVGVRAGKFLVGTMNFTDGIERKRWVGGSRIELQNSIPAYMKKEA